MNGSININGKDYEVAANAASPYIYKQIFHEDFLKKLQESDPDEDIFQKMFYVMRMQAQRSTADCLKLSTETYISFLEEFDPMDIIGATSDITEFYFKQTIKSSVPKDLGG